MRSNVQAPSLVRQRNGLLEVANTVQPGDSRWEDGVNFTPRGCQIIFGHDTKCWSPRGEKLIQDCTAGRPVLPLRSGADARLAHRLISEPTPRTSPPRRSTTAPRRCSPGSARWRSSTSPTSRRSPFRRSPGPPARRGSSAAHRLTSTTRSSATGFAVGAARPAVEAIAAIDAKLLDANDHVGGGGTVWMDPTDRRSRP